MKLTHRMRAGAETTLACSPKANPLRAKRNETSCQPSETCEPQALRAEIETNRTCCAPKSRRTERAARRNQDESLYPPLRGPGHKKALPIKAKLSTFTAGVPYQLMGKTCTCNQEKPKIKTGLCEPTVPTHQM